jgi:hypothetical protein
MMGMESMKKGERLHAAFRRPHQVSMPANGSGESPQKPRTTRKNKEHERQKLLDSHGDVSRRSL